MSAWKPIADYPFVAPGELGPAVLARTKDKFPMVVIYRDGHFYPCPGVPMFYGERQFSFLTADNVIEFMDIPE